MPEQSTKQARHTVSGNWRLGLLLSIATVFFWSTLPVAMKIALMELDPYTLTWFRFVAAILITGVIIFSSGRITEFRKLSKKGWYLLLFAAITLTANYVLYLLGLNLTTPANAQVVIQLAPALMAIGGLVIFGERYTRLQWTGFFILVSGLGLFFRDQLITLLSQLDDYVLGVGFVVLAAVAWASYALAQKQLLKELRAQSVMLFIYIFAALILIPTTAPASLMTLSTAAWVAVIFCAINTLGAYGAFAEALNHWEASRVSAILALIPLGTMLSTWIATQLWPQWITQEQIGIMGWSGALMVVCGSIITSLAAIKKQS